MITIYEQLKRAAKGEVLYVSAQARRVTSAASRTGRKVTTHRVYIVPISTDGCGIGMYGEKILKVTVLK